MAPLFSAGDAVWWKGKGAEAERDCVVSVVDERSDPATYILRFPDGSKKGSAEDSLTRRVVAAAPESPIAGDAPASAAAAPPPAAAFAKVSGMASKLFGSVGHVASDLSKRAEKTVKSARQWTAEHAPGQGKEGKGEKAGDASAAAAAATSGGSGDGDDVDPTSEEWGVRKLVEFGFPEHNARSALLLAEGDIERAVGFLNESGAAAGAGGSQEDEEDDADSALSDLHEDGPPEVDGPPPSQQQPAAAAAPVAPVAAQPAPPAALPKSVPSTSVADAFDFLGPATPDTPAAAATTNAAAATATRGSPASPSSGKVLEATSPRPGCVEVVIRPAMLPRLGHVVASHCSIGVKPTSMCLLFSISSSTRFSMFPSNTGLMRWAHFVDSRSCTIVRFVEAGAEWADTSFPIPKDKAEITAELKFGDAFIESASFDVCVRGVSEAGPAQACAPVSVHVVREECRVELSDLDQFLSCPGSPTSATKRPDVSAARTYYPPHAKGEIYDID